MQKLLIAVRTGIFADSLEDALSPYFEIHKCNIANDAIAFIDHLQPEVLILDLCLDHSNSLSVLSSCQYRPKIIIPLTNLINNDVISWAAGQGLFSLLMLPCSVSYVTKHILQLLENSPSSEG